MFKKKRFGRRFRKRRRLGYPRRNFRFVKRVKAICNKTGERHHHIKLQNWTNATFGGQVAILNDVPEGYGYQEMKGRENFHKSVYIRFQLGADSTNNWNYEILPYRILLFWFKDMDSTVNFSYPIDGNSLLLEPNRVGNPLMGAISPINPMVGRKIKILWEKQGIQDLQHPWVDIKIRKILNKKIRYYDDGEGNLFPEWKLYLCWIWPTPGTINLDFQWISKLNFYDSG